MDLLQEVVGSAKHIEELAALRLSVCDAEQVDDEALAEFRAFFERWPRLEVDGHSRVKLESAEVGFDDNISLSSFCRVLELAKAELVARGALETEAPGAVAYEHLYSLVCEEGKVRLMDAARASAAGGNQ